MARQYKNFKKFFEGSTLTFIPDLEDYLKNKRVIFRCAHGHMNDLNPDSFKNKRARLEGEPIEKLCIRCENDQDNKDVEKFEEWKERILKNSGHVLLEIGRDRSCVYECGNCKTKTKSFLGNIDTSLGFCPSCQNKQFIKDREEAEKEIYELSEYKVVEYVDSHNIKLRCLIGHEYTGMLKEFRRGRRCPECAGERRIKNIMERFGAKYFVQSDECKRMMMERYGTEQFVQSDEFRRMMMERYGSEHFVQSEEFKRIMLERYGVEHALQNPEIFRKWMRSSFSTKELVLPKTKRVIHVMGFEDTAITRLLSRKNPKRTINEDDIIVGSDVPTFKYIDDEKKNRVYYPDIHIKNTTIFYEIKSIYIFNLDPRKNYLKFMRVASSGSTLIVLIYKTRNILFDTWIFKPNKTPISRRNRKLKIPIEFDQKICDVAPKIIFEDDNGLEKSEPIDNIPDSEKEIIGDLVEAISSE